MPMLANAKQERFAQAVASGKNLLQAYREAGYSTTGKGWRSNPYKLRHVVKVSQRIEELLEARRRADEESTQLAVERLALNKEAIARALAPSVIGNVADFLDIDADGMPHPNFRKATVEQMAAIKSVTVEEFIDRSAGEHDPTGKIRPRRVRRVRFTLRDNVPPAAMIARMLGFIAPIPRPDPPSSLEERLRKMTPDEREQHAQQLYAEVIERLRQPDAIREAERMGIELIDHDD